MLPSTSELLVLFIVLCASAAGLPCRAQQAQPVAPVRYHFGDDPSGGARWTDPSFDDSAWPVAQNGRIPQPPAAPDRSEWSRARVLVPSDASGPLAIRIREKGSLFPLVISSDIFVNGRLVARRGGFPPNPEPVLSEGGFVLDLPAGLVQPGATAVVTYREWFQALACWPRSFHTVSFEIGESRNLRVDNHADNVTALLAIGPALAIYAFIAMMGFGLFVLWRWIGGRELLLCSGLLLSSSLVSIDLDTSQLSLMPISGLLSLTVFVALQAAQMVFSFGVCLDHSLAACPSSHARGPGSDGS